MDVHLTGVAFEIGQRILRRIVDTYCSVKLAKLDCKEISDLLITDPTRQKEQVLWKQNIQKTCHKVFLC